MSAAAAPWSVKGIDPKAREIAKDLARRSGMTLGEWLNTMIMDDEDDGVTPLPRRAHAAESIDRRSRARRLDDAYEPREEARAFSREPARDETLHRVAASVDAIAARLEAAERRSTVAVQGVDQAVAGLLRRLEQQDDQREAQNRRIDDVADELREGTKRLRAFEKEVGPKTSESFGKMETSIAAVTSRLYDIEERQRLAAVDLRQRMEAVETAAGPGKGSDLLAEVGARLDTAQTRTTEALRGLERSFAELDLRMRAAEARVEPEGARETARFEKMAETLSRQVETSRAELMRRLDTAETEGRIDRVERAMSGVGEQARMSEERSARAVEAMGQEVLRIAQNLNGRVAAVEGRSGDDRIEALEQSLTASITARVDRDMGRYAHAVEQRLNRTDDQNAIALEKLGGEITRISDRLADRIAQSERKSAQALEDIGRRLNENSERIEHRYDRASGELSDRMRQSEERTARLLVEARDSLEQRVQAVAQPAPVEAPRAPAPASDWRAAAFPSESLDSPDDGWSQDPLPDEPAPFAVATSVAETYAAPRVFEPDPEPEAILDPEPVPVVTPEMQTPAARPAGEPFGSPAAFGGFGGADVDDALEATAPDDDDLDETGDEFDGDTEFVDPRALRAGAAAGRAAATRDTIDAARAAMNTPVPEKPEPSKGGFLGFKRGGKSKLQERLDKQASSGGATVRKALLASVISVAAVGAIYATSRLTGLDLPDLGRGGESETAGLPLAAVALSAPATSAVDAEVVALYDQGIELIDAGDTSGLEPLTQAAGMGYVPAQLKLVGLYQNGEAGVVQDDTESRLWARRAAEAGDARGMHAFGMYLYEGVGGAENPREALRWLTRAADLGLVDSQFNAARILETGDTGIAPNAAAAFKWYLIAARSGDAEAQAAVERLTPTVPAAARQSARAEAEAFTAPTTG